MFQIKNVTLTHKKDLRTILDNFSLVLNDGDRAVMIGEEGNGKSTLMKWIYDPELVEDYIEYSGEKVINGERLGYLPQELSEQEKGKTVCEYFMDASGFLDKTPKELSKLANDFHVEPEFYYREQTMQTLSGGERVKAQMMRILIDDSTILMLDEPSNDIDIETLELMEKLINSWDHAVLFISHDETLIENTANRVIHFEQIRRKTMCRHTVANIPYRQYVEERLNNFNKQEQMAITDRKEKEIREAKYRRLLQKVEHAQGAVSRQDPSIGKNLKDKMHTVKAMGKRFERLDEQMTEMPEQEEAIFFKLGDKDSSIPSGKWVLEYESPELKTSDGSRVLAENIVLKIRGSEKIAIVGTNGCGKTTLISKIAEDLFARSDLKVQYMPQNYEVLLELDETPVDFLENSLIKDNCNIVSQFNNRAEKRKKDSEKKSESDFRGIPGGKEFRTQICTYLGSLKYTADEMEHPIRELSGGQKAKVLLLKLSMSGANVLILDEPTRNFSPLSGPVIRKMLKEFPGAIISVSHDRKYLSEVCDKIYRLTEKGLRNQSEGRFSD
ncbi:MAG: ABC-F family ATP-binding cassette domain-containing protein [Lachnospiraceae bacterium]|nr:ABC-F family ATP-binding cassette domain-containing protein [Lachnospiraceae bacterium]